MKTVITLLGAIMTMSFSGACGPTIQLRTPTDFTMKQVRDTSWNDRCNLQAFFESNPPKNVLVSERGYTVLNGRTTQERGTITFRVRHPQQKAMMLKILRRYYRSVPAAVFSPGLQIEVDYYRYCGRPRMLVGSAIVVRTPTTEHRLAYHPCLGEYLLNRDLYQFRSRHLQQRFAKK